MGLVYQVFNGVSPTAAAPPKVATGATLKTLLQIATPTTEQIRVVEWGISFDAIAAATPVQCELIDVNVAATVTQFAASDIVKLNGPNDTISLMTTGSTTGSGFSASGEGSVTAARLLDYQLVAPTGQYVKQFPLGREPAIPVSRFLRIRVTAAATVNATCYIAWEE